MRRWYQQLDFLSVFVWLCLCACGLVAIYSSTHGEAQEFLLSTVQNSFQRQLMWLGISLIAFVGTLLIPVNLLTRLAPLIYISTIVLLIVALVIGREVSGARSWVYIGPYGFQSSELAKIGALCMCAYLWTSRLELQKIFHRAGLIAAILVLPAMLIVLQNDLGTTLVFAGLIPVLWLCNGIPLRIVGVILIFPIAGYLAIIHWMIAVGFIAVVGLVAWVGTRDFKWIGVGVLASAMTIGMATFALNYVFQPYQVDRIVSFSNPEASEFRSGVGFHLVQSKAALGSGGFWGHGFKQGSQTQGRYIPEQSTDFVFSVIGEEWGFVGSVLVLLLFASLILRLIWLSQSIEHPFATCLICGVAGLFLIHVVINLGMVLGLLPVIGIPLPFFSYGGSALLTNSILLGLALSIYMRRSELSLYR